MLILVIGSTVQKTFIFRCTPLPSVSLIVNNTFSYKVYEFHSYSVDKVLTLTILLIVHHAA